MPDQVARPLPANRDRSQTEQRRREPATERPDERRRGRLTRRSAGPREHGADRDQPHQEEYAQSDVSRVGTAHEDVADHVAQDDDRREPGEHRGDAARDADVRAEASRAILTPEPTLDGTTILSSYRATA